MSNIVISREGEREARSSSGKKTGGRRQATAAARGSREEKSIMVFGGNEREGSQGKIRLFDLR